MSPVELKVLCFVLMSFHKVTDSNKKETQHDIYRALDQHNRR